MKRFEDHTIKELYEACSAVEGCHDCILGSTTMEAFLRCENCHGTTNTTLKFDRRRPIHDVLVICDHCFCYIHKRVDMRGNFAMSKIGELWRGVE
jgi:hypothetical protein